MHIYVSRAFRLSILIFSLAGIQPILAQNAFPPDILRGSARDRWYDTLDCSSLAGSNDPSEREMAGIAISIARRLDAESQAHANDSFDLRTLHWDLIRRERVSTERHLKAILLIGLARGETQTEKGLELRVLHIQDWERAVRHSKLEMERTQAALKRDLAEHPLYKDNIRVQVLISNVSVLLKHRIEDEELLHQWATLSLKQSTAAVEWMQLVKTNHNQEAEIKLTEITHLQSSILQAKIQYNENRSEGDKYWAAFPWIKNEQSH